MPKTVDVRIPGAPECWQSCGNCAAEALRVCEVAVAVGDAVGYDQLLVVLETNKVSLDIPSGHTGTVTEVLVEPGNMVKEGDVILRLAQD